ncbi:MULTISPECIES: hypothetical protein [Listeria]|uniref:hypothetical protein n=1 Tax=Listeria TaxID=1637 RepID=UPI000669DC53|nr:MULTISPECIES: hypothetical protein [Listeria]KMT62585.1 phosphotransferase system IIC component, glucose/maltose/N-acetylglucosamine-specific [Listeria newyorkensis]
MNKSKQWAVQLTGVLMGLYSFFLTLNISFDWLTVDSISAFVPLVVAIVAFGGTVYPTFKNTFLFKNGKRQAELIEKGKLYEIEKEDEQENKIEKDDEK